MMVASNPMLPAQPVNPPVPAAPCDYAIVQQVGVTAVGDGKITFQTRTQAGRLGTFTSGVDQVLASPPQGAPQPVAFKTGAVGNLYLSKAGWAAAGQADGLYGLNLAGAVLFKWPFCAPFRSIEPLDILPSSIQVVGDDGTAYELLGGRAAAAQTLTWTAAAPLQLQLGGETRAVWPVQINVTGKPREFPNLPEQTIDILDVGVADFLQTLAWTTPNAPVTLRLNEIGFETFSIVQEAIHQFAAGAKVTYPGALVDDLAGRGQNLDPAHAQALDIARQRVATLSPDDRARGKRPV